ncbi:MAG: PEP-CTERM sorting domain-containing protein [Pirellulales bacterium]
MATIRTIGECISAKWRVYATLLLVLVLPGAAWALPPLGLTAIGPAPVVDIYDPRTFIEVFGDAAYVSNSAGVWTIDEAAQVSLIQLVHSTFGVSKNATRVVNGPEGALYVGGNFGDHSAVRAALFKLTDPSTPVVTYPELSNLRGIDSSLRGLGNLGGTASWFHLDSTFSLLPPAPGTQERFLFYSSLLGYSLGLASEPGTLGSAPAFWDADGNFQFVPGATGVPSSIRDRRDGTGPNIGWDETAVKYGNEQSFQIFNAAGPLAIVSQGDFVALSDELTSMGYYPGIVPEQPNIALPLESIFPELASLDIDAVRDITAVERYLYMVLEAEGQLYLFGARDPSQIPEPASLTLTLLGASIAFASFRQRKAASISNQTP